MNHLPRLIEVLDKQINEMYLQLTDANQNKFVAKNMSKKRSISESLDQFPILRAAYKEINDEQIIESLFAAYKADYKLEPNSINQICHIILYDTLSSDAPTYFAALPMEIKAMLCKKILVKAIDINTDYNLSPSIIARLAPMNKDDFDTSTSYDTSYVFGITETVANSEEAPVACFLNLYKHGSKKGIHRYSRDYMHDGRNKELVSLIGFVCSIYTSVSDEIVVIAKNGNRYIVRMNK